MAPKGVPKPKVQPLLFAGIPTDPVTLEPIFGLGWSKKEKLELLYKSHARTIHELVGLRGALMGMIGAVQPCPTTCEQKGWDDPTCQCAKTAKRIITTGKAPWTPEAGSSQDSPSSSSPSSSASTSG